MFLDIFVALFAIALGAVFAFFGYRFFRFLLPVWGFFIGFGAGAGAIALLFSDGFLATVTGWVVGLVAGIIFAVLSYLFYALGILLLGGALGYGLAVYLMLSLGFEQGFITAVVGIIGGLIGAGLTVILNVQKWLIMVLMAAAGAAQMIVGLWLLLGRVSLETVGSGRALDLVLDDSLIWILIWALIVALGIAVQSRSSFELDLE